MLDSNVLSCAESCYINAHTQTDKPGCPARRQWVKIRRYLSELIARRGLADLRALPHNTCAECRSCRRGRRSYSSADGSV